MAVAAELRDSGAEVTFLGTRARIEAELVPAAGYEIDFLDVTGIDRRNPIRAAAAVGKAALAVRTARRAIRERAADVVMGGGGFVAGPAGMAAATLGVPLVLTEADSHLGLANRLLARRARRVCLAFPIAGREGGRYLVTGRPVPRAVLEADRDAARRRFGIAVDDRCLLVMGGSQGARSINTCAAEAFATTPSSRRSWRGPSATPCSSTSPTSATASRPRTSSSAAPAARSSRSRRRGAPRSWCRIRTQRRTTRPRTPPGWPRGAPPS